LVHVHAGAGSENPRQDAWQAYAERLGGGRVPIGAGAWYDATLRQKGLAIQKAAEERAGKKGRS
jgi:hypothetical protein